MQYINILLCDTFPGLIPPYLPSYADMFKNVFNQTGIDNECRIFMSMNDEFPEIKNDSDELYLISGSNESVYNDVDWVKQLLRWIQLANEAKIKVVGICFGHQAVAQALGGSVEKASQGWGTGIRESTICDDSIRPYFQRDHMRLLYNHHDQVVTLPPGAKLVAYSDFCPHESFSIGNHILTFQGHPEYMSEYEEHLIKNFADDEPEPVKQQAMKSLKDMKDDGVEVAQWILNWAKDK